MKRFCRTIVAAPILLAMLAAAEAQTPVAVSPAPSIPLPPLRVGNGHVYARFSNGYVPLLMGNGDTLTGPLLGQNNGTAVTSIHNATAPYGPANGVFMNPNGAYLDYCSVAGCLPGPHLLGEDVLFGTTHADASAQESLLDVNLTSSTGKATYWAASTAYAVGQEVHAGSGQDIYQVTVAGTSASSGSGPNFCPGLSANPQCSAPGTETNASTGTDGTVTWTFVGAGINDGKSAFSIAGVMNPGSGHFWTMDSSLVMNAGLGPIPAFGYELDTTNNNQNYPIPGALAAALFINGSNNYAMTAAIGVFTGGTPTNKAFEDGILFNGDNQVAGDTFADATSSNVAFHALGAPHAHSVGFEDDSNSTRAFLVTGSHSYGIDFTQATFSNAVLFGPNQFISFNGLSNALGYNGATGCLTYGSSNSGTTYIFEGCNNGFFGIAGHLFSRGNAPTVTGCSGTSLQAGSTDLAGTIIEGSSCTGATLTFAQANTVEADPFCVVMPWNNGLTPLTSYSGTAAAFAYTHASASGQKFTYHCVGAQ